MLAACSVAPVLLGEMMLMLTVRPPLTVVPPLPPGQPQPQPPVQLPLQPPAQGQSVAWAQGHAHGQGFAPAQFPKQPSGEQQQELLRA